MTSKQYILSSLEKNIGSYVSGQALADALGISRNAVAKNVDSLKSKGYKIKSAKTLGYCLVSPGDVLSPDGIARLLKNREGVKIEVYESVTSTNSVARLKAEQGERALTVIISGEQTEGQGRMGRKFYSPAGKGVYMSVILRPSREVNPILITTAACVAVTRAIESLTDKKPLIKWVNDVYLDGRKICGISAQGATSIEDGRLEYVILGIGVNLLPFDKDAPDDIKNIAGSIYKSKNGGQLTRSLLAAGIIDNIAELCQTPNADAFIEEYKNHSMVIGEKIRFFKNEQSFEAEAVDIDGEGGLAVRLENGEIITLNTGEITVRRI